MINFFVTSEGRFGITNYLAKRGLPIADRVSVRTYDEMADLREVPLGGAIFAALDQLTPAALDAAAAVCRQLLSADPGVTIYNTPERVLHRYRAAQTALRVRAQPLHRHPRHRRSLGAALPGVRALRAAAQRQPDGLAARSGRARCSARRAGVSRAAPRRSDHRRVLRHDRQRRPVPEIFGDANRRLDHGEASARRHVVGLEVAECRRQRSARSTKSSTT